MKSKRRKAYFERKQKKCSPKNILFSILLPLGVLLILFIFIRLTTKYWNNKDKFAFAFRNQSGEVGVTVIDPQLTEINTLVIPGETEVNVAEGYGTLRIKNVWQLGINEKKSGRLLSETVMQNFTIPVYLWTDESGSAIDEKRTNGLIKFIFSPGKTNIPFGDRLLVSIYSLKVKDLERNKIDLAKSLYLHKEKLNDGEVGYRLTGPVSERLTIYFSDNYFANKNLKFYILDATGKASFAQKVGQILEVMGGKVVSVEGQTELGDFDCMVTGSDSKIINTVSKLFSCTKVNNKTNFDLEIKLGTKFAKRF